MESGMNEVIPNLWLGDLRTALKVDLLRSRNIHSVLSVMRGKVTVSETFNRQQIQLDDTEDEDVLKHLVSAITFIQAELDKNRGVLVHCLAGVSRSVTIVAAYLMYAQGLDPAAALALVRKARPCADPNDNFIAQLDIFHQASYKVSKHDKTIRMFYLERMVKEVINGDGTIDREMLPNYPPTPSASAPATPGAPRRRIRCKMCRHELAGREHMLDHGQLGPPTPAVSFSPIFPSSPLISGPSKQSISRLGTATHIPEQNVKPLNSDEIEEAEQLGREFSDVVTISEATNNDSGKVVADNSTTTSFTGTRSADTPPEQIVGSDVSSEIHQPALPSRKASSPTAGLSHPSDLAAQLYANPKIAALRSGLSLVPHPSPSLGTSPDPRPAFSPPIIVNPKCSGYFVEPMKWMESFLDQGQLSGKIVCPNKKCGAKLGNYDWAGVCCSCKEWVVPGFCIHRSKVDEIV